MTSDYALLAQAPSVDAYCTLRAAAGLSAKTPEAARIGLAFAPTAPASIGMFLQSRDGHRASD